jgi:hypothetical protein
LITSRGRIAGQKRGRRASGGQYHCHHAPSVPSGDRPLKFHWTSTVSLTVLPPHGGDAVPPLPDRLSPENRFRC